MRFSEMEIEAARRLRRAGLCWQPKVGNYVFDEAGVCKKPSPFQDRIYYILNYSYFMRSVGGEERFKDAMLWLPVWEDLRELLRDVGVTDSEIAGFLEKRRAIEGGQERLVLYGLVESYLNGRTIGTLRKD